ncbi:protein UXT homolog [Pomacea canaliculata]|uniref:protein UXT homolog n=1 Tax=Pomacea canaliculata TaxID=400727 RepID=UPI000D731524|nr:protein UXT homolog [Pomacea canaliculata]
MDSKVYAYETFLNETLREDLKKIIENRDKVYKEISEYLQLKAVIEKLKDEDCLGKELKTKVDLGCNFYVQANVPDPSVIFVKVGFGFFVEFTLEEALKFIDKKTACLMDQADEMTKSAAKIKAHIKLVLEGLREIQHISAETDKPQRDIFL